MDKDKNTMNEQDLNTAISQFFAFRKHFKIAAFNSFIKDGYTIHISHIDGTEGLLNPKTNMVVWSDFTHDKLDWSILVQYIANYQNKMNNKS